MRFCGFHNYIYVFAIGFEFYNYSIDSVKVASLRRRNHRITNFLLFQESSISSLSSLDDKLQSSTTSEENLMRKVFYSTRENVDIVHELFRQVSAFPSLNDLFRFNPIELAAAVTCFRHCYDRYLPSRFYNYWLKFRLKRDNPRYEFRSAANATLKILRVRFEMENINQVFGFRCTTNIIKKFMVFFLYANLFNIASSGQWAQLRALSTAKSIEIKVRLKECLGAFFWNSIVEQRFLSESLTRRVSKRIVFVRNYDVIIALPSKKLFCKAQFLLALASKRGAII